MSKQTSAVEFEYSRLLGFDRGPRGEGGRLEDPRISKVGGSKDPDGQDDEDGNVDGIQAGVERLLGHPRHVELLAQELAERVREQVQGGIDVVVAVSMGGVVIGYELARQLGVNVLLLERREEVFRLRNGNELEPGARCLVADDTVMRGNTLRAAIDGLRVEEATVVAGCCLLESAQDRDPVGVPIVSLAESVEELEARLPSARSAEVPGKHPELGLD